MKSKQVLDVQQMQHLQELGMKMDYDTLYRYVKFEDTDWLLKPFSDLNIIGISCKYIPAYTLQDVLDALPLQIEIPLHPERGKYELRIKRFIFDKRRVMHAVLYEKDDYIDWFVMQSYETLIDAAYEMLVWCIENGYVETKKSKQGNDMRHV